MGTRIQVAYLDDRTQEAYINAMKQMNVRIQARRLPDSTMSGQFYQGFAAAYNSLHGKEINLENLGIINASEGENIGMVIALEKSKGG